MTKKATLIRVRDPEPIATSTSAVIIYADAEPVDTPIDGWGDLSQKATDCGLDVRDRSQVEVSSETEQWLRDQDGQPPGTTTVGKV